MELGNVLRGILTSILIIAVVVTGVIAGLFGWIGSKITYNEDYIESQVKITPEIKLTIVDNKVDTIYIYRKPKK